MKVALVAEEGLEPPTRGLSFIGEHFHTCSSRPRDGENLRAEPSSPYAPTPPQPIVALLLVDGQCRNEVAHYEWEKLTPNTIIIPPEITKTGCAHVPICLAYPARNRGSRYSLIDLVASPVFFRQVGSGGTQMRYRLSLGLALIASLSACTREARMASTCQAHIRHNLINPETAQFFDYKPMSTDKYRVALLNSYWREHDVLPADRAQYNQEGAQQASEMADRLAKLKTSFYSYRVKASSRVGNTVTDNYACAILPDDCICIQSDET